MPHDAPDSPVLDHLPVGVFTIDTDYRITSFNRRAEELTGFSRHEALGRLCYEILRADVCFSGCPLQEAMDRGERDVRRRVRVLDKRNRELDVEITAAVVKSADGAVIGGVESFQDDSERALLEKKVTGGYGLDDIVGRSPAMARLFETLPVLANSPVSVLVQGETGTGKGLAARALHNLSPRREKPFVTVNCAAIPDNLLESELFGYKKGAFTDASRDKPGRFLLADGGTIFLDEIGDMAPALQAKLLQVLEEGEFFPLGGSRSVRVDVRLVAATNKNLRELTAAGEFRADLFYRLNVASLTLPPLRDRAADIPLLAERFLTEFSSLGDTRLTGLAEETLHRLMRYSYPGNIRELKNILEYAAVIRGHGDIQPEDLPAFMAEPAQPDPPPLSAPLGGPTDDPHNDERTRILAALRATNWNRTAAAARLSMGRTTLWRRMKALGLELGKLV